ncbi:unnamed protein product [Rotaria sordida]|uniref:Calpain catalytic domain-containing protein n=1 Tax=Rotaria sordida TaxID=392033 RepID=A0A819TN56_9BILA|nr:unnamed protein product [Rotaria sordida]
MTNIKPFKNQNFKLLEEQHSSVRLFVDPEFPASLHSINHTGKFEVKNAGVNILNHIEWRRPYEIVEKPHFVIDGFQRRDIGQGALGNCWFMAAAGALTLNPELMAHVIPHDQTFDGSEYTVSASNEYNHVYRSSTTRAPSPVREIVINAATADLSQIQTYRAIQHQYQGVVSNFQIISLLNYHRSLTVPDVYLVDDFRSWCHEYSALLSDPTIIHELFVPKFYINSCHDIFVFIN